jgi:putative DNA primase/helicase
MVRSIGMRTELSAVTAATAEYFDNQDLFGQWLQESCDVDLDNHHLMERSTVLFES